MLLTENEPLRVERIRQCQRNVVLRAVAIVPSVRHALAVSVAVVAARCTRKEKTAVVDRYILAWATTMTQPNPAAMWARLLHRVKVKSDRLLDLPLLVESG